MTTTAKLSESDLSRFTGSENRYRHALNRKVLFTEGAKYVADQGNAYWLLDAIVIAQQHEDCARAGFQVWKLTVPEDRFAYLVGTDGDDNILYTQPFDFTDFPRDEITLWFSNGVIHLPSEH